VQRPKFGAIRSRWCAAGCGRIRSGSAGPTFGGLVSGVAGQAFSYKSQGFSLQREKSRFVLPPQIRNTVKDSSGDRPVLCLVKHDRWPCLMGFGLSRVDGFEDELDKEERRAIEFGKPFDRELKAMQLYGYSTVPFDGSGRSGRSAGRSRQGWRGDRA
jgi:hypothetical protein